jgi:FKBP-type peptidyl-prolyl cis-trans isomerase
MKRAVVLSAVGCLFIASSCAMPQTAESPAPATASSASTPPKAAAADDGLEPMLPPLEKEELVEGTGPEVKKGDHVAVHYTGTLTDGTKFDSSFDRGTPLEFTVGDGSVIPGWELGIIGMKKGGKRKLTIPPHLAYGLRGSPPKIPPNATLVFVMELVDLG